MSSTIWYNNVPRPWYKLDFINRELMIPGPTNMSPRVLKAMSRPILSHTDPQFHKILRDVQDGLRYLFQTHNEYTFAITGTATCAMEMAICNLLEPGQRLLTLVHGYWGDRVAAMSERLGLNVNRLVVKNFEQHVTLEEIEHSLQTIRPQLFYVCQGDSSLGTVQSLDGIGELCRRYDCLLMIDAVVSLCTSPLSMDDQQIDVVISGAQKALSGPPGLGLISFGKRAVCAYRRRNKPPTSFYMDLDCVAHSYGINNNGIYAYHYTHAINLIYGLHEAILLVAEEGIENVVARHQKTRRYFESEIERIGLQFLIPIPDNRLAGITSVKIPDDIDGVKLMSYLTENFNILIGGSILTAYRGFPKFWRIGYLGVNADLEKVKRLICILEKALLTQRELKSKL